MLDRRRAPGRPRVVDEDVDRTKRVDACATAGAIIVASDMSHGTATA
jgi:hypothetical protein